MLSRIRKRFLLWDALLPTLVTLQILLFGGPIRDFVPEITTGMRDTLYGTIASISAGLLGFVITGVTILLTLGETRRVKRMIEVGMYDKIVEVFISSARWLAGGVFLSLLGLVLDRGSNTWFQLYCWIVFNVTAVSALRIMRCLWVLSEVSAAVISDKKRTSDLTRRTLPYVPIDTDPRRSIDD